MKSTLSLKHNDKLMNLKHNNRSFDEKEWGQTTNKHIDRSLSQYNTTFIKEDIKQAYEKVFGEALKEYNDKQKKKSRRIDDYYEYIKEKVDKAKGKKKGNTTYNLQDEVILTIGNKEMWDNIHQSFHDHYKDHEKAEEAFIQYKKQESDATFKEFLDEFQAKHKHLYVFNAVAHYDEKGAPHMHMNFFGMAEGLEKGLRIQPRTTRAIAQDLDGDFYEKMQATSKAKNEFEKENRRRKKAGLEPLQADRKAFMSASADVYTQFLSESKQIFIEKARAHGFEYVPGETNPIKDLHTFKKLAQKAEQEAKETAEKLLAKANKEINEYKEAKLSDIDKEAGNKQAKIKELDKDLAEKKSKVEALENATEMAAKAKDEASREERIARQNAEIAQKQADSFKAELERIKSEKTAQEAEIKERKEEISELNEQIADQTLELEQEKEKLEAEKNLLKDQVRENTSKISEQEARIDNNKAFMAQQTRQHDEQIDFLARRNKALAEIENVSKVKYGEKGVIKALGRVTIGQEHYENLKKKAGFFDSIKSFANNLVSTIKETSVYKEMKAKLQAEVAKWKGLFESEQAKNADLEKEKSNLEKDNDKLRQELGDLHYQNAISRDIGKMCEKYLTQDEKNQLYRKLDARAKDREEEDKRLERDDFSYDYDR